MVYQKLQKKTGQVVLLRTTPRHVRGMDHRGNLGEHLLESLGTRLQEDHSCVDATEESPRGIHIILRPPHEATIDLRPMWPVAVATNHCRGCLQIEEIVQALQGDRVQIEKEHLRILDEIPSMQLGKDAIETITLPMVESWNAIDVGYSLERPLLAEKLSVV